MGGNWALSRFRCNVKASRSLSQSKFHPVNTPLRPHLPPPPFHPSYGLKELLSPSNFEMIYTIIYSFSSKDPFYGSRIHNIPTKEHRVPHKLNCKWYVVEQFLPSVAVFFLPLREQFQRISTAPWLCTVSLSILNKNVYTLKVCQHKLLRWKLNLIHFYCSVKYLNIYLVNNVCLVFSLFSFSSLAWN